MKEAETSPTVQNSSSERPMSQLGLTPGAPETRQPRAGVAPDGSARKDGEDRLGKQKVGGSESGTSVCQHRVEAPELSNALTAAAFLHRAPCVAPWRPSPSIH